jgi:hypothetical protein
MVFSRGRLPDEFAFANVYIAPKVEEFRAALRQGTPVIIDLAIDLDGMEGGAYQTEDPIFSVASTEEYLYLRAALIRETMAAGRELTVFVGYRGFIFPHSRFDMLMNQQAIATYHDLKERECPHYIIKSTQGQDLVHGVEPRIFLFHPSHENIINGTKNKDLCSLAIGVDAHPRVVQKLLHKPVPAGKELSPLLCVRNGAYIIAIPYINSSEAVQAEIKNEVPPPWATSEDPYKIWLRLYCSVRSHAQFRKVVDSGSLLMPDFPLFTGGRSMIDASAADQRRPHL